MCKNLKNPPLTPYAVEKRASALVKKAALRSQGRVYGTNRSEDREAWMGDVLADRNCAADILLPLVEEMVVLCNGRDGGDSGCCGGRSRVCRPLGSPTPDADPFKKSSRFFSLTGMPPLSQLPIIFIPSRSPSMASVRKRDSSSFSAYSNRSSTLGEE